MHGHVAARVCARAQYSDTVKFWSSVGTTGKNIAKNPRKIQETMKSEKNHQPKCISARSHKIRDENNVILHRCIDRSSSSKERELGNFFHVGCTYECATPQVNKGHSLTSIPEAFFAWKRWNLSIRGECDWLTQTQYTTTSFSSSQYERRRRNSKKRRRRKEK